jgi:epoxyqueuosine reductase QueG
MIHPQFGLWHSYRFALLGTGFKLETTEITAALAVDSPRESPCLDCVSKPCLHSCPVAAFDDDGYAVERCFDYLQQRPQADCHQQGCLARIACPIAPELSYVAAQRRFHLRAFLQAQQARSDA